MESPKQKCVVYILQLTSEKLSQEHQRIFKSYLLHLFSLFASDPVTIVIEAYFQDRSLSRQDLQLLFKLVCNGYNFL